MRGLSRELAIAGHDYFEVVFYYKASNTAADPGNVIARTSWELYKDARITGVYGKKAGEGPSTGISYASTSVSAAAVGSGAAVLFVGKKTDRTLLAIGRLAQVNGATSTIITPNTATVTFDVSALKSGIDITDCGFFTDANYSGTPGDAYVSTGNTIRQTLPIYGKDFPLYKLRVNGDTYARYNFALDGADTFATNYPNSIILAGNGSYGKRQPRFPVPDGGSQKASLRLDNNTEITALPGNNTVPDPYNPVTGTPSYFNPSVRVKFNTAGTLLGSAFAFIFEIPVYALTARGDPGTWYIRPSYDSYFLDLDNGLGNVTGSGPGSAGGAVLLGTGEVAEPGDLTIRVIIPPLKYLYPYTPLTSPPADTVNNGNRRFNVNGLVVELLRAGDPPVPFVPPRYLDNDELYFEIGMADINVGEVVPQLLYGIQTITVLYMHPASGAVLTDTFLIICNGSTPQQNYTNIPQSHYFVLDSSVGTADYATWFNAFFSSTSSFNGHAMAGGPGTYIIVAATSFDFPQIQLQEVDNPFVVIVVASQYRGSTAADPIQVVANPINLGRDYVQSNTRTTGAFNNWGNINAYYFGKWPFNAPLQAPVRGALGASNTYYYTNPRTIPNGDGVNNRTVYETSPFTLNAAGTFSVDTPTAPALPPAGGTPNGTTAQAYFLQSRQGGGIYNVQLDPNPEWLKINNRGHLY
jgi:hypothetical protein